MNIVEIQLVKLMEECNEVSQRCSKALRFGIDEIEPNQPLNNSERIQLEMAGLLAAYRDLMRADLLKWPTDDQCNDAHKKATKFIGYSISKGTLQ